MFKQSLTLLSLARKVCCNDGSMEAAQAEARKAQSRAVARSFKDPDNYENLQFFYHPDHLGSSSFITNLEGEVVQHIEYVPFGEVFIEARNNVWNTPYLFNAKEFDEETGMYYYGARYYDPRLSLWMSTDPMEGEYQGHTSYCFSGNSPVIYVDFNGKEWTDLDGNIITDTKNIKKFIFYSEDFRDQAKVQYQDGIKTYGAGSVALSQTSTTRTFSEDWRNMNGTAISEVLIMTHGKNQSILVGEGQQFTATGDGKTNITRSPAPNIQDLPQPQGNITQATLYMYSCHSADSNPKAHGEGDYRQGPLMGSKHPIAYVFAQTFKFYTVQGTAESVNYHHWTTDFTMPWSNENLKPYPANGGKWKYYFNPNNSLRKQGK